MRSMGGNDEPVEMKMRTKAEAEANLIDLEMFRLADRIDAFADDYGGRDKADLRQTASSIRRGRYAVRARMHRLDKEETA